MESCKLAYSFVLCLSMASVDGACAAGGRTSLPADAPPERGSSSGDDPAASEERSPVGLSNDADDPSTTGAADEDLARARAQLEEARAAEKRGDHAAARAKASEAIEGLLSASGPGESAERVAMLFDLGTFALAAGELKASEVARRRVLEVRTRTLPADHADLQAARQGLAATIAQLGDLKGARALFEQVLEVRTRTLPADHPDLQGARQDLAVTIKALGDLQGARVLGEQVLEVWTRTLPADHPDLQRARQNLAVTIKALGDLQGARALEEQVLEVRTHRLPADHPDLQAARQNLAATMYQLRDLEGARALFEQVLEVRMRTLPTDHPGLQAARQNLAATMKELGDLEGARTLFEQVLEARTRMLPADHPDLQAARLNLAATITAFGDLQGARVLEEQVLEVRTRTLPADHPDLQRARQNLAVTMKALGDLHGARALQEQVLEVRMRTLPADHPDLQKARQNLATTLQSLGDYSGARALKEQVLEVRMRTLPEDHPDLQAARQGLAVTISSLGDLQGARALQEQVLEVYARTLPADHPDLLAARQGLAATIKELGDVQAARAIEEQVLEVQSRRLPADHPDLQLARQNLANTLDSLGELADARVLEEQVLEVRTRTLPADHPDLGAARLNLATTIAAESARSPGGGEVERARCADLIHALAGSCAQRARTAKLSSSSRQAEEICSSLSDELSVTLSFAAGYGALDADSGLVRDAFVLSETTRAGGLAAARIALLSRSDERYANLRREIRAAVDELARLAQAGAAREAYAAAVVRRDRAQRDLVQLASQSEDAAGLLTEPDPAALSGALTQTEAIVAYRRYTRWEIPAGETQERSTESLCAFVLRKGDELQLVELGGIQPIEDAVKEWRDALGVAKGRGLGAGTQSTTEGNSRQAAARIREMVFDPLASKLRDARRLILVLDDVLQAVQIEALPVGAMEGRSAPETQLATSSDLLGDRYAIELRSTTQELLTESKPPDRDSLVLLLGGADYHATPAAYSVDPAEGETAPSTNAQDPKPAAVASMLRGGAWSAGFRPLPGAEPEARGLETLARQVGDSRKVVRLEHELASRASIEALAPKARFLHLATHGWFAPESVRSWSDPETAEKRSHAIAGASAEEQVKRSSPMLLCGLALAGANLPADAVGRYPGLITAEEISAWDLSNCELAVLSACDTNVGERRAGQGVASLQKALHMAGARTVITSIWKVPDEATKELMLDFYRRIWIEKKPKAQALWEAKKKLREARDESGRPRYSTRDWAAWVLTGNPD